MSLKNLIWNLTSDGKRPLQKDQRKWDKDKQEFVPVIPRESEILCLCKYADEEYPFIMKYNLYVDGWVDTDSEYSGSMPFDEVEKWYPLSDIDDYLEGNLSFHVNYPLPKGSGLPLNGLPDSVRRNSNYDG